MVALWLAADTTAIVIYLYIVYTDFARFEITNASNLLLLAAGLIGHLVDGPTSMLSGLLTGGLLFAFTFPFWMKRVIGAGDVKLLGISGFIVSIDGVLDLAVLMLVFSIVTIVLLGIGRYLLVLPTALNRRLEDILKQGKIPYGVPLSLAAICVVSTRLGAAL